MISYLIQGSHIVLREMNTYLVSATTAIGSSCCSDYIIYTYHKLGAGFQEYSV